MYRRAILRTFQIAVDFYYVGVGVSGGRERGAGERGRESTVYCTGTVGISTVLVSLLRNTV